MKNLVAYLDSKRVLKFVCQKQHRHGNTKCLKAHAVPDDAVWVGDIEREFLGELREYKRAFNKAYRKWNRTFTFLIYNSRLAAPAFVPWVEKKLAEHRDAEPKFAFRMTAKNFLLTLFCRSVI